MLEFQHLRGFQGLNYSLKFAESLTLDKLKTWYYGIIGEREERKKRERQERAGFPSPFTPNPLRREKRESKEREKREKERVPATGETRGVCRLCGGKAGRNSIYYYRHITPRIFSYLNNRMQAI